VELGNIKPNEKKTVAFYLDPQICMESYIDCTLTYYDFEGKMHHVDMKRRPVDIVCPIFYTPKTVNVAMLRRLISELRFKDSKFYTLPKAMTPQQAFERSKNAIERHDIKFVREYVEEEVAGQYMGEAWYYGKTKTTEEELVIRTTVTQRDRSLEIFVASSNLASMTGLLSELGQNINQKTAGVAYKDENQIMQPTTGAAIREVSGERALLLDKYSSKELDAGADLETAGPTDPKRKKAGGMAPAGVQAPQPQPQQPPKPAGPKKDPLDDLDSLLKDL
jgi:hypothetical protein